MGEKGRDGPGLSGTAATADRACADREAESLVGTEVKVHPGGAGALKKRPENHRQVPWRFDQQASCGCCVAPTAIGFWPSPGQARGGPEGRKLLSSLSVLADRFGDGPCLAG